MARPTLRRGRGRSRAPSPRATPGTARSGRPGAAWARPALLRPCAERRPSPSRPRPALAARRAYFRTTCSSAASDHSRSRRFDSAVRHRLRRATAALVQLAGPDARAAAAPVPVPVPPPPSATDPSRATSRAATPRARARSRRRASRTLRPDRSAAWVERSEVRAFGRTPGRTSGAAGSRVRTSRRS